MVDNIPPEIAIPLAVVLWLVVAVMYRRDVIKKRKQERNKD